MTTEGKLFADAHKFIAHRVKPAPVRGGCDEDIFSFGQTREDAVDSLDRKHPDTRGRPVDIYESAGCFEVRTSLVEVG